MWGSSNAFGLQLNLAADNPSPLFRVQEAYSDRIAVLKLFPGMDPDIFRFYRSTAMRGLHRGLRLGGVPFLKGDFTAKSAGRPTPECPSWWGASAGTRGGNLRVYETGQRILECGGIPVHNMTQEAVVTKLMLVPGQTKGEISSASSSRTLVQEVSFS